MIALCGAARDLEVDALILERLPADQILAYTREREIDRIVMGTHCPGPIGKLLVGSVAEAVLRKEQRAEQVRQLKAYEGWRLAFAGLAAGATLLAAGAALGGIAVALLLTH